MSGPGSAGHTHASGPQHVQARGGVETVCPNVALAPVQALGALCGRAAASCCVHSPLRPGLGPRLVSVWERWIFGVVLALLVWG